MAPALIGISIMYNSFFETTYASFVRMYYQKTFDGMMATPLSLEEIILARDRLERDQGNGCRPDDDSWCWDCSGSSPFPRDC